MTTESPTGNGAPNSPKRRAYAPRVSAEERRAQLLDAALHLVVTRDHAAVTMEAVAEQAGVTKPVVYGMYANRAELLAALLKRETAGALSQVTAALPTDLDPQAFDVCQAFGQLLHRFLDAVRDTPDRWYCVVMSVPGMPAEFQATRERIRGMVLTRTRDLIAGLQDAHAMRPGLDAEITAHTVVTLFEMAAQLVLTDPEHFQPERVTTALSAAIGLSSRSTA